MSESDFWETFSNYGEAAGAVFPDCVAAQAALESGFGAHLSGENNYFGIKGTPGTTVSTMEHIGGKWITIKDTFKDFDSPFDCVKHLVNEWYKDYASYKGVNRAKSREDCAKLLILEGYATDPRYSEKLIKLMDKYVDKDNLTTSESFLEKAAIYYAGERHQTAAWRALESRIDPEDLKAFKTSYRSKKESLTVTGLGHYPLDVPYFYQRDSKTGHGERMCFSSSMAMAMDFLDPQAIEGDDDWYLNEVFKFGDSVSSSAQVAAAESLGFDVVFRTDLRLRDLENQLDKGIPVPIGILHKGTVEHPAGGGHWICAIGYDDTHFYVHDPFGELSLIDGGYPLSGPNDGKFQKYSKKNLSKRWEVEGSGSGWGMIFS
jgi:hypothetical protein